MDADLGTAVSEPKDLHPFEKTAWQMLSHWIDDDDIREKDAAYGEMQRGQLTGALNDLEALEAGYEPSEVELGEHQATHIPLYGCLITLGGVALLIYLMFANGFFMHGD